MEGLFGFLSRTSDGVFAVDRGQRIALWNDGARRILGFEADSVCGRHCFEIVGGTDENGCVVCRKGCAVFEAALCGELSATKDVRARTRGGAGKWINVTTVLLPSKWQELSLLVHVFRDVGQSKATEYRLKQALRELDVPSGSHAVPSLVEPLTHREAGILRLLAAGASTSRICGHLGISKATARTHVQHVLSKLGVHSRLEAVASALRNGLL